MFNHWLSKYYVNDFNWDTLPQKVRYLSFQNFNIKVYKIYNILKTNDGKHCIARCLIQHDDTNIL